ncbi:MAG TPA: hypothetical protein VFZ00_01460 [Solirubrobacter sp.]|nr:hypothetical protein [Solirubrobacter sp.]
MPSRDYKVAITGDVKDLQRAFAQGSASAKAFERDIDGSGRKLDEHAAKSKKAERDLDRFNAVLGNTTHQTKAYGRVLESIKPAALIAGVGVLTQGLSAAAAGATALAAGVAPAAGGLAAYPAVASAAAQGLGVVKLATVGVADALGGLNDKLDEKKLAKLTPEAQRFVRTLDAAKPAIRQLQRDVQRGLFDGVGDGLKAAGKNADVLERQLPKTAKVLGGLARDAGHLAGSKGFGRDLELQMERNDRTIQRLGHSALDAGDGIRHIVIAAGPLVDRLGKDVEHVADAFDDWAKKARGDGTLEKFFDTSGDTLETLGHIVWNVARGVGGIVKAGYPLGHEMLGDIEHLSKEFGDWSNSMRGQNALREYFADSKPAIYEAAGLVGDLGKMFLHLGRGNQVAPLLHDIRTLVPDLERVLSGTTQALGPELVDVAHELLTLWLHIAGTSGPLQLMVQTLGEGLHLLNEIVDTVPGMGAALATLAGAGGVAKALNLTAALTGVKSLNKLLGVTKAETAAVSAISAGGAGAAGAAGAAAAGGLRGALTRVPPWAKGIGGGALAVGGIVAATDFFKDKSDLGLLDQYAQKIQKVAKAGDAAGMRKLAAQLREVRQANLDQTEGKHLEDFAAALDRAAKSGGTDLSSLEAAFGRLGSTTGGQMSKVRRDFLAASKTPKVVADAIEALEHRADGSLDGIRTQVRMNMRLIARTMKDGSEDARQALAKNFEAAADRIGAEMRRAGKFTKDGVATMRRYVRSALALYGIEGAQADSYVNSQERNARGTETPRGAFHAGDPGAAPGKAGGGWIGMAGERGADTVPVMLGRGEAVLNHHQQAPVDYALQSTFGMTLDDLFATEQRPHYMAKGGIVALGRRLQRQGYNVSENPAFGGVHPVHVKGSLHYRGQALDINADNWPGGEPKALDRLAAQLKGQGWHVLWRVPDHYDHLHVDTASGAGGLGGIGAAPKVKNVRFPKGMGAVSALGQAGMDTLHGAAQAYVDRLTSGLGERGGNGTGKGWSKQRIRNLWVRAGGDPKVANLMAAIALAESGGDPGIVNSIGAGGLWQIHPAEPGYLNPLTNAKIAVRKLGSQGLRAWEAYTNGSYRQFLARGGRPGRRRSGNPRHTVARTTGRPHSSGAGALATAGNQPGLSENQLYAGMREPKGWDTYAANVATYYFNALDAGIALASLTEGLDDDIAAVQQLVTARDAELQAAIQSGDPSRILEAATSAKSAHDQLDQLKEQVAAPTAGDWANMDLAMAQLTPDTGDDLAALNRLKAIREGELTAAQQTGDPRKVTEAAQNLKSVQDSIDSLNDTIAQNNAIQQQIAQAQQNLADELKRVNDTRDLSRQARDGLSLDELYGLVSSRGAAAVGQRRRSAGNGVLVTTP